MASALTSEPGPVPGTCPVKILLVDDQPSRLLTYRTILEPLGEELVEAHSGVDALKRLMESEFAVILLDVNMPGMDGFETATMIHQHPRFENTPIIFVSAVNVSDFDRLRGYKLGAVDYIMVPVIPEIMRTKVAVLAELYRKRRELQAINAGLSAENQALQLEKARELEALNQSLIEANAELAARNRELIEENRERTRAEQRLRIADQRKDEFLATLAHELRNPLAPLQNALQVRRLSLSGEEDPLQALMERQLALLVRMIDDLLDVARISRGKLELRPAPTLLQDIIAAAVDTATPLIEARQHRLSVTIPDQPVRLIADAVRLGQVVSNLLNNAAKYSDPGGRIELDASVAGSELHITVRDEGIGLAADQLEAVFELFHQVDTAIERSHGGLGIGLTLVQRLSEMHEGRVEVLSEGPGRGCTFRVVVPCRDPDDPRAEGALLCGPAAAALGVDVEAPAGQAVETVPETRRHRVLVVDDNRDAADTLAMMIRLLGNDVHALYDPGAVEAEVLEWQPSLIFLDVGMPGRSGYDVARALRAMPGGDALRIVAVTGWGQVEDRARTREAGFDEHLVKPPAPDVIRRLCQQDVAA
ncbi:response regulator [Cognatilysobacter tabacisoli]|uniref:response regulator n=1 Tax=Cognatilysobacter tabacisoli TaxID=2315424 RepID=UPI000E6AF016|nr:response regulator [Lysobacter tabacisoli]